MSRGSPLKGVAMTIVELLLGVVGTDVSTGTKRFTFGLTALNEERFLDVSLHDAPDTRRLSGLGRSLDSAN